jgi:nucleoporin NUP42
LEHRLEDLDRLQEELLDNPQLWGRRRIHLGLQRNLEEGGHSASLQRWDRNQALLEHRQERLVKHQEEPAALAPFGSISQPQSNPFGAPSTQNPNSFGAQNAPAQPNPFGNTPAPFGAPSQASKNPFGAPSQPANPLGGPATAQPSPWGAAPAASSPFSNPPPTAQPLSNPFSNPQPTSQPAPNPFSDPQPVSQPTLNPFANPAPSEPVQPNASPFEAAAPAHQQSQPSTNGSISLTDHPQLSQYSTRDNEGRLLTWKDKRVIYKDGEPGTQNFDGTWQKIWFPNGPPLPNKWAEAEPEQYTEEVKKAYEYARKNGGFEGGMIPLIPPKQEWCRWDF